MTDTSMAVGPESKRYPLSFTQEWFVSFDQGDDAGPFGRRFVILSALRITGQVDLAVLQGALDDVVARHELLRTLVVRDADPPYQMVCPPCQVPLEVTGVPPVAGKSRDLILQELVRDADAGTMSAREVPLMRAQLWRFDDRDSALFVMVHHSVSDGWSMMVILRDLGAFYAARVSGVPAKLPEMRQYREYAEWQRATVDTSDHGALSYWADKLDGARELVLPNDHGQRESYSRPYSMHIFNVDADTMAAADALARATRSTQFMVIFSAIFLLANQLTGATDLTVRSITSGRNEIEFHNTMGLFLNVLPFRTEIADCASFRDVVVKNKETSIDVIANELPAGVLEQSFPDHIKSREDKRMSLFLLSVPQSQFGVMTLPIAEGATAIEAELDEEESSDVPSGMVWYLNTRPDGTLNGAVQFNLDEFEASTAAAWAASFKRILASAVRHPDQDWRQL
jgi:hypothetical protein